MYGIKAIFAAQEISVDEPVAIDMLSELTASLKEAGGEVTSEPMFEARIGTSRADFLIDARFSDAPFKLVVEAKRSAFPRDVREAIWQLKRYIAAMPPGNARVLPLLMANTISPGARALLREEKIGYFDRSGSLYLSADNLFVLVEKPASKQQARSLNNLFVGSRSQALHAVWTFKDQWFGAHELAERASVSPTTASQVLIELERREWVNSKGAGPSKVRRLSNPRALLEEWSSYVASVKPKPLRSYYMRMANIDEAIHQIDRICDEMGVRYEISGLMAGQIHAPHLSKISQLHCRIDHGGESLLRNLGAKAVKEGWNLGIIESDPRNDFLFRQRVGHVWVTDPLQTYLDLLQLGSGRSKELAEHLRLTKLAVPE
jgi:DNA-binding transcriptional regulator YhcF (GntR family)